jgi:hypothetical protein
MNFSWPSSIIPQGSTFPIGLVIEQRQIPSNATGYEKVNRGILKVVFQCTHSSFNSFGLGTG